VKVSRNQDGTQMTQIKRMTTDKEKKIICEICLICVICVHFCFRGTA